jgi:hypothetical protein
MQLRPIVAYPFKKQGQETIAENDVVVALSMDRGWFDPEGAEACLEAAVGEGLVERVDGGDDLRVTFDYAGVDVPNDVDPDPSILESRSVFEVAVDRLVQGGLDKRDAVATINGVQDELGLTVEVAALLVARRRGAEVSDLVTRVRGEV